MSKYILHFSRSFKPNAILLSFGLKGQKLKSTSEHRLPEHLREFCDIPENYTKAISDATFDEIRANAKSGKLGENEFKITIDKGNRLRVEANIKSPLAERFKQTKSRRAKVQQIRRKGESDKYITNLKDLCEFFYADNPEMLNRRIYKDTNCGASISVYLDNGKALHNGDKGWNKLNLYSNMRGFTIQTIVEGSDATVDSDEFTLPVLKKTVSDFIDDMEDEAERLWNEANNEESVYFDDAAENPRFESL